jgi:hypothetical protein
MRSRQNLYIPNVAANIFDLYLEHTDRIETDNESLR